MATRTEVSNQRGLKRPGDDSLDNEQRLAKRFNLLNIDNDGKLYIPVSPEQQPKPPPISQSNNDLMQVEDTKDKVYIYDLDAELAESEPDEEHLVFIPDIERHFAKVPKHVLTGQDEEANKDNQLILYQVPTALSVPENKDSVRKAILEARSRAQQKQEQLHAASIEDGSTMMHQGDQSDSTAPGLFGTRMVEDDADAMDIE
ncbi:MAG: hypothetical protein M1822_002308 [Bathelium mastoideum]|nr:MAG: hypothetical protein M1822_002308 [Bathelium mastoideum]